MFLQSYRWKWKETSIRDFLKKLSKKNIPMDVFIILQISANDFRVRTNGEKQQHYKKLKQMRYFCIISIADSWRYIGCTYEGFVINHSWSAVFIHQNTKSCACLNIYSILEKCSKALLKIFLIDVGRSTLPGRPQDFIFKHIL